MSIPLISERTFQSREFPPSVLAPMNALLFGSGQQGAWYDPSDLSALFQDAAGTTPVTGMEQPVGRVLDLSGNGNHASQATTTKRGVVSRRVNLLTNSGFAAYTAGTPGTGPTSWPLVFSLGETLTSVEGVRLKVTANRHFLEQAFATPAISQVYEYSVDVDVHLGEKIAWLIYATGPIANIDYFLDGAPVVGTSFVGTGTHTVLLRITTNGTAGNIGLRAGPGSAGAATGDITLIRGSFLRLTDAHPPYQWVNTATDYDDNAFKFPTYLKSDGIDDSYSSATGGGGNAGFFFSQAITVLGGAGTARTLFSDAGTNTGYIVRLNTSNQLELAAGNGTAYTTIATAGTLAVNTTDVVQAWDDGTNLNVKIGTGPTASIARPAVVAGTAGYTMGQDNGASTGYINRRMYSTVYRKDSAPTQVQREAVAVLQRLKARMP